MIINVVQKRIDQIVFQRICILDRIIYARPPFLLSLFDCCRDDPMAKNLDVKDRLSKRGAKKEFFELPERILKTLCCCARGEVEGLRER